MIDHQRNLVWSSLDELFASENMLWFISLDAENWINGKCSCPYFQKNYKCKHLLGLSHSKGLDGADISDAAKQIPLNQKRPRGRPEKAKPALSRHHANNGN